MSFALQHQQLTEQFKELQSQHSSVEAAYSDELLNAAKLHSQLAELQLLRTQNTMYGLSVNQSSISLEYLYSSGSEEPTERMFMILLSDVDKILPICLNLKL